MLVSGREGRMLTGEQGGTCRAGLEFSQHLSRAWSERGLTEGSDPQGADAFTGMFTEQAAFDFIL